MTDSGEPERITHVRNRYGLHARPAAEFVKLAARFRADVWVRKEELEVNGKSIMGLMMLAAEFGTELTIRAAGADATTAVAQLAALIESRFGEE
jgi:phosphocarrier protein HPr